MKKIEIKPRLIMPSKLATLKARRKKVVSEIEAVRLKHIELIARLADVDALIAKEGAK